MKFAFAVLGDPDLLILDEPTAGMDASAWRDFWEDTPARAATGTTVLFSTHYPGEAEYFAQRSVMPDQGRVVADAPTPELFARAVTTVGCEPSW